MSISMSGSVLTFTDSTIQSSAGTVIPSGTAMLFQQTSAPTGWTKVTTYNDYAIRIVNGTASTGGSTAFSTCFTNQTPTINVSGLSAGATTLSTAQVPAHTHSYTAPGAFNSTPGQGNTCSPNGLGSTAGGTTGSAFTGGSHTHSISGSASSTTVTLAVQYVDHIIATKN